MSEKKQTAVMWLKAEIKKSHIGKIPAWVDELYNQALQMEREQIVLASEIQTEKSGTSGEQYYTDTYGE